eukprot:13100182-Alexandrium_andersonii.AAC.1
MPKATPSLHCPSCLQLRRLHRPCAYAGIAGKSANRSKRKEPYLTIATTRRQLTRAPTPEPCGA